METLQSIQVQVHKDGVPHLAKVSNLESAFHFLESFTFAKTRTRKKETLSSSNSSLNSVKREKTVARIDLGVGCFDFRSILYFPQLEIATSFTLVISGKDYWSTRLQFQSPKNYQATTILRSSASKIIHLEQEQKQEQDRESSGEEEEDEDEDEDAKMKFQTTSRRRSLKKKPESKMLLDQKFELVFRNVSLSVVGSEIVDFDLFPDDFHFRKSKFDIVFESVCFHNSCKFFFCGSSPGHFLTIKECHWGKSKSAQSVSYLGIKAMNSLITNSTLDISQFEILSGQEYPTTCTLRSSWVLGSPIRLTQTGYKDVRALILWCWKSELFQGIHCSGRLVLVAFDGGLRGDSRIDSHTVLFDLNSTKLQILAKTVQNGV